MPIDLLLTAALSCAIGLGAGIWIGKNPAQAKALQNKAHTEFDALVAKVEALVKHSPAPNTTFAPAVPWALGDSYTSLTALLADIEGQPGCTAMIRVDGSPVAHFNGTTIVDFHTVGTALVRSQA